MTWEMEPKGNTFTVESDFGKIRLRIRLMTEADLPDVEALEKKCFTDPWNLRMLKGSLDAKAETVFVVEIGAGTLHEGIPAADESAPQTGESFLHAGESAPQTGESSLHAGESAPQTGESSLHAGESAPQTDESLPPAGQSSSYVENFMLAGYMSLMHAADEGELLRIAVDPICRRKGIADRLMETLAQWTGERKIRSVFLEVRSQNEGAIALYKKHGFESLGLRKNYYHDPDDHACIMKKEWIPD